jgi:NADP-dependent 3-hydroxy acid dehydrogenase YdfG
LFQELKLKIIALQSLPEIGTVVLINSITKWGHHRFTLGIHHQMWCGTCVVMQVNAYSADVKDFASVKKAFDAACSESGNVTAVVLSHGVAVPGTFEDTSIETMEHMLDTNLKGNIHAIKAVLPFIKSSKSAPASIAIFSSQAGQVCA